MITTVRINNLIIEELNQKECFVVDLEIKEGNNILLEVDSLKGVSIQDCVDLSKAIEHNLDREEEDFELSVSSAGLDKPLRVKEQYIKNIGRQVKVVTTNDEIIKGELTVVNKEDILIVYTVKERVEGKKKKQSIRKEEKIPFNKIRETTIIISFK